MGIQTGGVEDNIPQLNDIDSGFDHIHSRSQELFKIQL
jgi:hypothetical protein